MQRSSDHGQSWSSAGEIDAGLPSQAVTAVAVHPTRPATVYLALRAYDSGATGGLFESIDGGAHWTPLGTGLAAGDALSVAADPLAPSRLYAGIAQDGVYRSADAGSHWAWANSGLRTLDVGHVVIDPDRPGTVYAGPANFGLYKTTDAGLSWQLIDDRVHAPFGNATVAPFLRVIVPDPTDAAVVYGVDYFDHLLKSTDGGTHFSPPSDAASFLTIFPLTIDPAAPSRLYAGGVGEGEILTSADGGVTWQQLGGNIDGHPLALAVDPVEPGRVWAGTDRGVFVFDPLD